MPRHLRALKFPKHMGSNLSKNRLYIIETPLTRVTTPTYTIVPVKQQAVFYGRRLIVNLHTLNDLQA
jgi:hypothetical protein